MSWRDGFKKFTDKLKEIKDQAMANLQLPSFHASKIGREIEIEGKELEETLKTCGIYYLHYKSLYRESYGLLVVNF